LILTMLSSVRKDFSGSPRTKEEISVCADGLADMFSAYVVALNERRAHLTRASAASSSAE
jgi:hypothetical protein